MRRWLKNRQFAARLLVSCCLTLPLYALGQARVNSCDLNVSAYNVEHGLSQSTVNRVIQDRGGLVWLISGGGLQLFDGSGFRSFAPPENISRTGNGNTMTDLVEEGPNSLVISTRSSVMRFNRAEGKISIVEQRPLQYPRVFDLVYKNRLLCWAGSNQLCLVGDNSLIPVRLSFAAGSKLAAPFSPLWAVKSGNGNILLAWENGYLELKPKMDGSDTAMSAKWIPFSHPCKNLCTSPKGDIYLLADGIIWSLGPGGILSEVYKTGIKESNCLFVDRSQNFWIADKTRNQVYRIAGGKMAKINFISAMERHTDTIQAVVRTVFEDKRGNLWIGTDGDGMLFHSPGFLMFDLARIGFTRCITYFSGDIWAGTFKNGLWRLSEDLKHQARVGGRNPGDNLYYYDLATDSSGRMWAATNKGVYIYDGKGSVVFHKPFNTSSAKFLTIPHNRLLLSTYSDLYECKTGKQPGLSLVRKQTQLTDVLVFGGCYWVGNPFGLYRTDTSAGMLEAMSFRTKDRLTSIPINDILALDGSVWAGTGTGIECYSPDGKKKALPGCITQLAHEAVYSLLEDSRHRIWFSGSNGIGCISRARDSVIRFTSRNNLQSSEFNINAKLVTPGGRIFFGGIKGLNGLDATNFTPGKSSPKAELISLSISDSAYTSGIPAAETTVHINWKNPHLGGTVFTSDYLPEGIARYSFFLEGYDDKWSSPSAADRFIYRNLPPGKYTLWARCIDPYQNQGQPARLLKIIILPPFWKRWEFITALAILFITILALGIRKFLMARKRNLVREFERLNAIERERLRISQDMHDEIGASLTQIAILSEIVKTRKGHPEEATKLIDQISGISGNLVDEMGEIIWAINPKNDDLPSFVYHLRQHASEYLSMTELYAHITIPETLPGLPMSSEQRRNMFLVVKEALHNIVKHSGAKHATLVLSVSGSLLTVIIEDDGRGFDMERSKNLGNGLASMQKRIADLHGTYRLSSEPGKGSHLEFSVSLTENKTT